MAVVVARFRVGRVQKRRVGRVAVVVMVVAVLVGFVVIVVVVVIRIMSEVLNEPRKAMRNALKKRQFLAIVHTTHSYTDLSRRSAERW